MAAHKQQGTCPTHASDPTPSITPSLTPCRCCCPPLRSALDASFVCWATDRDVGGGSEAVKPEFEAFQVCCWGQRVWSQEYVGNWAWKWVGWVLG